MHDIKVGDYAASKKSGHMIKVRKVEGEFISGHTVNYTSNFCTMCC